MSYERDLIDKVNDDIERVIEEDISLEAVSFAESASEIVESMEDFLERANFLTDKQIRALENIEKALNKWLLYSS